MICKIMLFVYSILFDSILFYSNPVPSRAPPPTADQVWPTTRAN